MRIRSWQLAARSWQRKARTFAPGPRLGTIALLALTALALALAATHGDGRQDGDPTLDSQDLARISIEATPATSRRVERLRDLEFEHVPDPEVITGERLGEIERKHLRRSNPYAGLAADEAAARMLGLLDPSEQLEDSIAASGELAAAAYDPATERMYVISDAVAASAALVEFVLAHELVHALEDQRFGLTDPERATNDDEALAGLALTEGTATALMVEYAAGYLNPFELALAAAEMDPSTGAVPAFVVDQLEWTYLGGMRFVNELRRVADGWKLVDYALAHRPPATTEQVLHPIKYLRDEPAVQVEVPAQALRAAGWRRADAGVFGELATRLLLELGTDRETARGAAAGWGGDRYELWRRDVSPASCTGSCRGDLALVARWHTERGEDAVQLDRALADYLEHGLGATRNGRVWSLDPGYAAVFAGPREEVTLALAPDAELASTLAEQAVG